MMSCVFIMKNIILVNMCKLVPIDFVKHNFVLCSHPQRRKFNMAIIGNKGYSKPAADVRYQKLLCVLLSVL